jgi:iron(III) transport system substrate-binding protein
VNKTFPIIGIAVVIAVALGVVGFMTMSSSAPEKSMITDQTITEKPTTEIATNEAMDVVTETIESETATADEAMEAEVVTEEAMEPEIATADESMEKVTKTGNQVLTIYSGRAETLVGPLIVQFEQDTGIKTQVRYGDTAAMALAIMEEGQNSPADVYFAQDAGALGALANEGRLLALSPSILEKVDPSYRSSDDEWVGISGRARVVNYNTNLVDESELPNSIWGFLDPKWKGKIGWAPSNGSFQSFVTALRVLEGEDKAKEWLVGIMANEPRVFSGNAPIVEAVGRGEIHVGFVNNYYMHGIKAKNPSLPVANHYTSADAGSMINIAGAGIVDTTKNKELAEQFIQYMLEENAQAYFATTTYEYPLVSGVDVAGSQASITNIVKPQIDLNDLDDLQGTLELLKVIRAL